MNFDPAKNGVLHSSPPGWRPSPTAFAEARRRFASRGYDDKYWDMLKPLATGPEEPEHFLTDDSEGSEGSEESSEAESADAPQQA